MNLREAAEKHGITTRDAEVIKRGMTACWDAIASDWFAGFDSEQEAYETFENDEGAMIAEATLDGGRIDMYGGEEYNTWAASAAQNTERLDIFRDVWNARGT